jgi:hypothetical protein
MILNDGRESIAHELQKVAEECGNETFSLRRRRQINPYTTIPELD